ncbi:MAG: hypothetical protein V4481_00455 [Patescibacteria group bacterium]
MEHARCRYERRGVLTRAEIDEVIGYDFVSGPSTVRAQVRRYYLKVKEQVSPKRADQMLRETERLHLDQVHTDEEAHDLCVILSRYIHGFVIYPDLLPEVRDEMSRKYQLPLKMMTVKTEKPYHVWHHGERSTRVQWKAWRQGRPTILGYGMTEDEAIADLRYLVQPDHDGTLDGLGKPKGCVVGGNMHPVAEMVAHNKGLFPSK